MRGLIAINTNKIKGEYLNGAYSELAALLGIDAVLKLHGKYRGTQLFFPVELFSREFIIPVELFSREFIIMQIIDEYNGHNIKELATKYGYTEKWVRKILKDNIDNKRG